jgi:hypothetical protein
MWHEAANDSARWKRSCESLPLSAEPKLTFPNLMPLDYYHIIAFGKVHQYAVTFPVDRAYLSYPSLDGHCSALQHVCDLNAGAG